MRYVALLRAVNVGGRTVKMERLRALFEAMKLRQVETFIASGNVIFESSGKAAALEARIEKALADALGFNVPTLLRSAPEIAAAADRDAFPGRPTLGKSGAVYVGFLKAAPESGGMMAVEALGDDANAFALHGRELYWRAEDRRAVLDIPIATFERALGCETTFRNVTTVRKLADRYCR
jgi:uncharacterized protein (DUF1697 family)